MDNGVLNKFSSCNSSIVYCGGHVKKKKIIHHITFFNKGISYFNWYIHTLVHLHMDRMSIIIIFRQFIFLWNFFHGNLVKSCKKKKKIKRGSTGIIHTRKKFGVCRPKDQVYLKCGGTREEGHKSARLVLSWKLWSFTNKLEMSSMEWSTMNK
jgi:hypothetical protein